jgi:hypothetical protein
MSHAKVHRAPREGVGMQILCHAYRRVLDELETVICLGSDDDLVLPKELLKRAPVVAPPRTAEVIDHDFHHDDVISLRVAGTAPKTLRGGPRIGCQPSEHVGQFLSDLVVVIRRESLTRVVVNRKKNLHEMWHDIAGS